MKFQAITWFAEDVDDKYIVKIFGSDVDGNSVCMSIDDFLPYFYVKVPIHWNSRYAELMSSAIEAALPDVEIERIKFLQRKDFWGFTNDTLFLFARIEFKNLDSFKKTRYMFERRTILSIAGIDVQVFEKEQDLLMGFRKLITDDLDPDVITGYNINGFDFWVSVDYEDGIPNNTFDNRVNSRCVYQV
eukprot:gene12124-15230_t